MGNEQATKLVKNANEKTEKFSQKLSNVHWPISFFDSFAKDIVEMALINFGTKEEDETPRMFQDAYNYEYPKKQENGEMKLNWSSRR